MLLCSLPPWWIFMDVFLIKASISLVFTCKKFKKALLTWKMTCTNLSGLIYAWCCISMMKISNFELRLKHHTEKIFIPYPLLLLDLAPHHQRGLEDLLSWLLVWHAQLAASLSEAKHSNFCHVCPCKNLYFVYEILLAANLGCHLCSSSHVIQCQCCA